MNANTAVPAISRLSRVRWIEQRNDYYTEPIVKEIQDPDGSKALQPANLEQKEEKYAITWRLRFDPGVVEPAVDLMINSQALREALKEVAPDYSVSLDTQEVVIDAPYAPIYHTSKALEAYAERRGDEAVKEDVSILLREVRERQGVGVKDAATLASKGRKVICKSFVGERQIAIVSPHYWPLSDKFRLRLEYVDWCPDGAGFHVISFDKEIEKFNGSRQICSLDVFPLEYFRHAEYQASKVDSNSASLQNADSSLIRDLVERGRQLQSVCKMNAEQSLREYSGQIKTLKHQQVMLDVQAYFDHFDPDIYLQDTQCVLPCVCSTCERLRARCIGLSALSSGADTSEKPIVMTDEQCLLCPPRVFGFVLKLKMWAQLKLTGISPINVQRDDEAFKELQMDQKMKDPWKQLVLQHSKKGSLLADLTHGKGNGLIVLLHGPPGVGKTLTAEALATLSGKPLYPVTMSDVGTSPAAVETNMNKIFQLATQWKALLLFDEADIFLEKRSLRDRERNSLVSVLLRILEYFSGILFLTTNRVKTFDEAFQSRIHVAVQYKELNDNQKSRIWNYWLDKYHDKVEDRAAIYEEVTNGEWLHTELNGRQIRNIFSCAMALAGYDNHGMVNDLHIKRVMRQTFQFQMYMDQTRKQAETEGLR
ncbi:hypothetical protein LTR70_009352 [Exophiala xenobiotica]|nr:hypothetical protein LTR70_009352 [Exophiala xenobiotica]